MYYAHSRNDLGLRHDLVVHLRSVADLAAQFAAAIGAEECGRLLGLWHDVGKFSQKFQDYLAACEANPGKPQQKTDHKTAGTILARRHVRPLALIVQGHHGGLHHAGDLQDWIDRRQDEPFVAEALRRAMESIRNLEPPGRPMVPAQVMRDPLAAELFVRMLFSALVDADVLDTERHFDGATAVLRGTTINPDVLWQRLDDYMRPRTGQGSDLVSRARHQVYQACLEAAENPPGLFRLAVPTDGGKTLAGMAFALRHMLRHGHRRIIVAVPFISITEQTASVYRQVLEAARHGGRPVVLEHHSGVASV